jgi:putative membrane protein
MWKRALTAAALVALVGGCEDRNDHINGTGTTTTTTPPRTTTEALPRSTMPDTTGTLAAADSNFVKQASSMNLLEIDLGQMGAQQAQSPDVKSFAEMIRKDHTDANDQLKSIASSVKADMPREMLVEQKAARDTLSQFKGADFDREFLKAMVDGHQTAISLFQRESTDGQNDLVKGFARAQLPTLKMHLEQAQKLQSGLGSPSAPPSTPPAMPPEQPSSSPPA